jgi:hypothetical protein
MKLYLKNYGKKRKKEPSGWNYKIPSIFNGSVHGGLFYPLKSYNSVQFRYKFDSVSDLKLYLNWNYVLLLSRTFTLPPPDYS